MQDLLQLAGGLVPAPGSMAASGPVMGKVRSCACLLAVPASWSLEAWRLVRELWLLGILSRVSRCLGAHTPVAATGAMATDSPLDGPDHAVDSDFACLPTRAPPMSVAGSAQIEQPRALCNKLCREAMPMLPLKVAGFCPGLLGVQRQLQCEIAQTARAAKAPMETACNSPLRPANAFLRALQVCNRLEGADELGRIAEVLTGLA